MNERGWWSIGLAGMFGLSLVGGGICLSYRMSLEDSAVRLAQVTEERTEAETALKAARDEAERLQAQLTRLEAELASLRDELAGKDAEMRTQRDRLGQDLN